MAGIRVEVRPPETKPEDRHGVGIYEQIASLTIHFDGEAERQRASELYAALEQDEETSQKAGMILGLTLSAVVHEFANPDDPDQPGPGKEIQ